MTQLVGDGCDFTETAQRCLAFGYSTCLFALNPVTNVLRWTSSQGEET